MKNKFIKEKKMKNKILSVAMASLILASSFPVNNQVYASMNNVVDAVTQATENDSNILKELTKDANSELLVIRDGIYTYKLKIFVNKHANFVEGIVDETDTNHGVYGSGAMIWGQFKAENNGLKKYGGKTFGEVKAMPTPEDIIVMGGQRDDIPKKVHKKILEFITNEEAKADKEEKEKKNELARSLYKYRYRYVYKDTQIWDATTLSQFLESYNKAREVLEKSNPNDSEISERINDLETKYKAIKAAPFSDEKYKELVKQAEEKINNKEHYTLSTMAELERVLAEVRNDYNAKKIKNLLEMKKVEAKLQKALDQLVTKEESKRRFNINGKLVQFGNESEDSMANNFMNPSILLIEESNSNIYEITFVKKEYLGISSEVEKLKYNRDKENWQEASLISNANNIRTFRLVMNKADIDRIELKTFAKMGKPELSEQDVILKLDQSTKRPEGSQLEEGNKKKLKDFIDSINELNKDINDGLYKEPESSQFAGKYVEATKLLESNQVTDEAIEAMIRSLMLIKQELKLKIVDDFAKKLGKAEGITGDKQSKEKYTEKSLAKLQAAVDAGNAVWRDRFDQPKEEIARLINLLDTAMADLKQKGQEEEENPTEGKKFTAPVKLMQASNPTKESMANGAIVSPAKLIYSGDKVKIELEFKGLDLKGPKGHLTKLFYFENNISPKDGGKPIETKVEKKFMDTGLDGQKNEFPQVFSFTIDRNVFETSDFLWCRVWVDIMDGFKGGTPGAGAQEARIAIDKTNLPKEEPLNKEELTNLITKAKAIEQGKKTEEAFNTLKAAITSAEEALNSSTKQTQLDEAVTTLKAAVETFNNSPDKEAKNKTELEKLLHEQDSIYQDVLKGEYKEEGSKLYLDKYKEAIKLLEDPKAKEEDINDVIKSLKSIKQNRLILKILDDFQDLIVKAEEITNKGNSDKKYTDASFNKLKEAVNEANKYWNNRFEQPKKKIESLNKMLKDGLEGLKEVPKVVLKKEALTKEIAEAKKVEQGKKTEEAFNTLKAAIKAAEETLKTATDQETLNQGLATLKAAVKAFRESADKVEPQAPLQKEALTKEIETAKAIAQDKKTDEAFNTLKAAITTAEKVLGEATEQTQLDEAVKTLKAAVKAFNESANKVEPQAPLQKEALTKEIAEAKKVEQGKKTDEAFNTLKAAIAKAEKVLGEATEQTQLDEAVKTLKEAVKIFNDSADKVEPQAPLQKEALTKEIASAKEIVQGKKTDEAFNTLKVAITSAEKILNSATEQTQLDEAVKTLKTAVKAFNVSADKVEPAPQPGPTPQPKPSYPSYPIYPWYNQSNKVSTSKTNKSTEIKKQEVKEEPKKEEVKKENLNQGIFTDINGHWAKEAINYVVEKRYFAGVSATEFAPNKGITRGQLVTVLGRILNIDKTSFKSNNFKDVKTDAYYAPYIAWAESVGITKGRGSGSFDPDKEITREEMAVMMVKFLKLSGKKLNAKKAASAFKDDGSIESWAKDAVMEMAKLGLVKGMEDGSFSPKTEFTRAQVAQILYNIDKN